MTTTLVILALGLGNARAETRPDTISVQAAEADRLSGELRQLARREVWNGVEDVFAEMRATGLEIDARDWVIAARAAEERGDVTAQIHRLERAVQLGDASARPHLSELYDGYARVVLDAEGRDVELGVRDEPFDPSARRSIAHARAQLREEGHFDGYLPVGDYHFGGHTFQARLGWHVRLDIADGLVVSALPGS